MTITLTTRYVSEREMVFSPNALGFPSIKGCHAIVLVTESGLFGFHNLGGETKSRYEPMAQAFHRFVTNHPSGGSPALAVYGACFLTGRSAYEGAKFPTSRAYSAPAKESWLAELSAFGEPFGVHGPIYGLDLGTTPALSSPHVASAYVEFTRVGGKCVIQTKVWNSDDASSGTNTDHVNVGYNPSGSTLKNQEGTTITTVRSAGVKTGYPETLKH